MRWNHREYGRLADPIHKSHLVSITGDYGCPKRFQYDRNAAPYDTQVTSGKAALGNATHEVIAEMLTTGTIASLLEHDVRERLLHHVRAAGPVEWYGDNPVALVAERVAMVVGLMRRVLDRVQRVIALEAGFIVQVGEYWCSGHVDILYEPTHAPGRIALADWKSGAQKPHQLELNHGWEAGLYSAAVRDGMFIARGSMTRDVLEATLIRAAGLGLPSPTYGVFPSEIHQVHLGDYVPYVKAGTKVVKRPEDMAHYGMLDPGTYRYAAGQQRGGAWMPVAMAEHDIPRLTARLRAVVGMVRLGRFFDRPGERCTRCAHRGPCLADGYVDRDDPHLIELTTLKPRGDDA